jgi:hypothetical protein
MSYRWMLVLSFVSLPMLFAPRAALAQSEFTGRLLLPIVLIEPVRGAHGSHWSSDLWIYNGGTDVVRLDYECQITCPGPIQLAPGTAMRNLRVLKRFALPGGYLRFSPASSVLEVSLHVRDESRLLETWGTEVPVVRDGEFLAGIRSLVPIPTGERERVHLRFYTRDEGMRADFRLRIFSLADRAHANSEVRLLGERVLSGIPATSIDPGYAELVLSAGEFPMIPTAELVRVEVEPLDPNVRYWMFAAITNNDTQQVTLVTP